VITAESLGIPIAPAAISRCSARGEIELPLLLGGRVSAGSAKFVAVGPRIVSGTMMVADGGVGRNFREFVVVLDPFSSVLSPFLGWLDESGEGVNVGIEASGARVVGTGIGIYLMLASK
jgi:hypothetical protein